MLGVGDVSGTHIIPSAECVGWKIQIFSATTLQLSSGVGGLRTGDDVQKIRVGGPLSCEISVEAEGIRWLCGGLSR
jgi:hypothetical protein